jgi:branched-chain amino acid transport system permease protein
MGPFAQLCINALQIGAFSLGLTLVFGGSGLAAVSGGLLAPLTPITPALGSDYLTKAFIIIIIGGLGSLPGAILGSFLIAAIESVAGCFFDVSYATIAMFALVFLLVRPEGMLGYAQR